MQTKVLKFGGSSLASAAQFRKAAAIILADPDNRYVVASAPGKRFSGDTKVTDLLYALYDAQKEGGWQALLEQIAQRYREIIRELSLDLSLEAQFAVIRAAVEAGAGRDYLASRGEYLNAQVLAAFLGFDFIDAADGVCFTAAGAFDAARTYALLSALLAQSPRAVLPGFYGSLPDGSIRTFSRGGSDITGAIVARAANAAVYENWTDVSGMLMADPRIVEQPRVIREITYRELRELAYMGATVLHDEAVFPVREACIPINIRNTNEPSAPGTWIVPKTETPPGDAIITGVAGVCGFSSVTVEKDRMNAEIGFGRKVLTALEELGVSFEHIPSGIDTISVVTRTSSLALCRERLTARIFELTGADSVRIEDELALIAVVGRGMERNQGTAGRVFTAVAQAGINIRMIDQGAGENNIILGVGEADYVAAIRAIYHEFVRE